MAFASTTVVLGGSMTRGDIVLAMAPPALWALAYKIAKPVMRSFPPMFLMSFVYALTAFALFRPWQGLKTSYWALFAAPALGASVQSALIFSGIALVPHPWLSWSCSPKCHLQFWRRG